MRIDTIYTMRNYCLNCQKDFGLYYNTKEVFCSLTCEDAFFKQMEKKDLVKLFKKKADLTKQANRLLTNLDEIKHILCLEESKINSVQEEIKDYKKLVIKFSTVLELKEENKKMGKI
jgi:hypothetical protein